MWGGRVRGRKSERKGRREGMRKGGLGGREERTEG